MSFKSDFLPKVNCKDVEGENNTNNIEIKRDTKCPCCGYITIPNKGDALAYICPICMWEIDLFINSYDEPSDKNYGLSLKKARENYKQFGAVLEKLKQYCREPKEYEEL